MFKKLFLFLFLILLILCSNIVYAEEAVQIELKANNSEVAVGDSFQIFLQLKNASTADLSIGSINIPGIENFSQRGSSQSTKVQVVNGATTAITETTLTLVAMKEGKYTIGPVEIKTNNLNAQSNSVSIKVTKKQSNSSFDNKENNIIFSDSKSSNRSLNNNWILNILALILLGAMLYLVYKRKRDNQSTILNDYEGEEQKNNVIKINVVAKNDEKFFEKTKEAILLFVQKKYKIDTESLTSQEVVKKLKHIKTSDVDKTIKALDICDQGYFALKESGKNELLEIIKKLN